MDVCICNLWLVAATRGPGVLARDYPPLAARRLRTIWERVTAKISAAP